MMENLKPDTKELTVELLIYMSSQLNNVSMPAYTPKPFTAEQSYVLANALFFTSLAVLLITSLLAILVKSWIRDFDRNLPPPKFAEKRAKEREYRFRGLIVNKMPEIVASLPILIQLALILFCVGLLVYLNQANVHIMIATGCIFSSGVLFYLLTTTIAVYDSSAPFPSPLSRFLSHAIQWVNRFPFRVVRWIRRRRSTPIYDSFRTLHTSFPRDLLVMLRTGLRALVSSRNSRKSSDLELHVLNRLANETLVVPENSRTFTTLVQYLALHSRLRPIARQEWRDIISTIFIIDSTTPLLTTRGILRVIVFAYDPTVGGSDALLNLASALIDEKPKPAPIPLSTDLEKQGMKGLTPASQHFVPSMENISLVLLSPLQPLVQRLKHTVFSVQDWSTAIEEKWQIEEITQELVWLADFFQSRLYCALNEELRSKLLESGIQLTQDVLVLASWLPTKLGLPLVSASIRIGLALRLPGDSTSSSSVGSSEQRQGGREKYFSVVNRPSTDPEAMCSDLVSLLDPSRNGGHPLTLCLPAMLALWHLDPPSSLLSVHKRKGKLGLISKLVDVEAADLDHFSILNFAINSIPRKRIQYTFMVFIECWDQLAKDPVIPLKKECLQFFEMALKRLEPKEGSSDDPPLPTEDRLTVMERSASVQNPWIILAGDPIRQAETIMWDVERMAGLMEQTPWVGDERYEHIVRDNLEFYCSTADREPYLPILVLFEQSTELLSYLRALYLSSHRNGVANKPQARRFFTETRVARFTKIASRIFKEERTPPEMLEIYLILHTELFTYYEVLLPEFQKMIATAFQQEGGLQWLSNSCKQLEAEVQKTNLADSDGMLVKVASDQSEPPELMRLRIVVIEIYLFLEDFIPQFTVPLTSSDISALQALLTLPGYFGSREKRKELEALVKKLQDGR
jgi:hypothetical protein